MKITSVDVFELKPMKTGWPICIRVNTDEGISGFGEVGLAYGNAHHAGVGIARDFAQLIIDWDPMKIEKIWENIFRNTFWGMGGGTIINGGISAIDIALWDIKGKTLNKPVYELLGGKTNTSLRAYASQLQFDWDKEHVNLVEPEKYGEAVKKAMAQGYTAVKVDPIGINKYGVWMRDSSGDDCRMRGKLSTETLKMAYNRVKAMREAGGDVLDIIIELHSFTDTNTAIQLGLTLEELNIYYYEEPVHPLNVESMLEIHKKLKIPIASGERIYTRWGYREFLEKRALQVIQPDVCLAGGITETKKICDMANIYDAGVQVHVCGGPISTAAAMQIESVIPNFLIHEMHEGALKEDMRASCKYDYMPVNGHLTAPDLPGIGQELSEHAMRDAICYTIDTPRPVGSNT
jgi:galactonate dehydratase